MAASALSASPSGGFDQLLDEMYGNGVPRGRGAQRLMPRMLPDGNGASRELEAAETEEQDVPRQQDVPIPMQQFNDFTAMARELPPQDRAAFMREQLDKQREHNLLLAGQQARMRELSRRHAEMEDRDNELRVARDQSTRSSRAAGGADDDASTAAKPYNAYNAHLLTNLAKRCYENVDGHTMLCLDSGPAEEAIISAFITAALADKNSGITDRAQGEAYWRNRSGVKAVKGQPSWMTESGRKLFKTALSNYLNKAATRAFQAWVASRGIAYVNVRSKGVSEEDLNTFCTDIKTARDRDGQDSYRSVVEPLDAEPYRVAVAEAFDQGKVKAGSNPKRLIDDATPEVTLEQAAFVAFKIENRLTDPLCSGSDVGTSHCGGVKNMMDKLRAELNATPSTQVIITGL